MFAQPPPSLPSAVGREGWAGLVPHHRPYYAKLSIYEGRAHLSGPSLLPFPLSSPVSLWKTTEGSESPEFQLWTAEIRSCVPGRL